MYKPGPLCLLLAASGILAAAQPPDVDEKSLSDLSLEELANVRVQTATLRKQTLRDAPASVTVITAEDIHRYGYRTLAEVLSNVRSFYMTSDGPFRYAGVRGFSLLGDYNSRFLVMINGHHLTDNVYGAMYYFGQDFPLDMDLVDQIEIVRGPSSALYGSNGIFATINIITKTPKNAPAGRVSTELGSLGEQKVMASSSFTVGRNVGVLLSATGFHTGGRTVNFPELEQAGLSPSRTGHAGDEHGSHIFANLTWKDWTVTALFGDYKAIVPTGWYGTTVGDTGTTDLESRNFVEAAWSHPIGQTSEIRWRGYYDQYRYDGVYDYDAAPGYRNFDGALGDWVGNELVYHRETGRFAALTIGAEANVDVRNIQYNFNILDTPAGPQRQDVFRMSHRRASYGIFLQEELKLSPSWIVYLGGRVDDTSSDSPFFSPRIALVYTRNSTAYKLMYGRAFRNPSTFERYYDSNPALQAERINTVEFSREQNLRKRLNLITSVFQYRLGGLIQGALVGDNTLQYRNESKAVATGLEGELNGHPADWLETSASFSVQRTRGIDSEHRLQNSPVRLGQFRATVPLARQRLMVSGAVRYVGSRLAADDSRVAAVPLADLTVTALRLHPRLDLQLGVRNLMNTAYSDPLSPEHAPLLLLPRTGRTFYVKLTWRNE